MRAIRLLLAVPVLLLFTLACGLTSNLQKIQEAATQLPGMLTAAPTMMGPLETAAAKYTPGASGQPLSLENIKLVLEITQQFKFTDETVDDQPAAVARLTDTGKVAFPHVADGFSAAFIGSDPNKLSHIRVTMPRSNDQATVDEGTALMNIVISGSLPPDVQVGFLPWLTENYSGLAVSDLVETTLGTYHFALQRSDTAMVLDISPK